MANLLPLPNKQSPPQTAGAVFSAILKHPLLAIPVVSLISFTSLFLPFLAPGLQSSGGFDVFAVMIGGIAAIVSLPAAFLWPVALFLAAAPFYDVYNSPDLYLCGGGGAGNEGWGVLTDETMMLSLLLPGALCGAALTASALLARWKSSSCPWTRHEWRFWILLQAASIALILLYWSFPAWARAAIPVNCA